MGINTIFIVNFLTVLIRPDLGACMPVADTDCPVVEASFSWTQLSSCCSTLSSDSF